jgi:putative Holliday junction resolvase
MGRILGIDFGLKRIGAAISDPGRSIAFPMEVYQRASPERDAAHYRSIVAEESVERIVVGLPVHASGIASELSRQARNFGGWLARVTGRPVAFQDERYTSVEAEDLMRSHGLKRKGRKARRDMLAAQILLQTYLDAGCPESDAPPAPLDDPAVEEDAAS